jgi:hypothetical protein
LDDAEAARKPVDATDDRRAVLVPGFEVLSRSSFMSRAMRSKASCQRYAHSLEPGARYSGYFSRLAVDEIQQRGALGTERAAIDRMVGVAPDVDDLRGDVFGLVPKAGHDEAAATEQ